MQCITLPHLTQLQPLPSLFVLYFSPLILTRNPESVFDNMARNRRKYPPHADCPALLSAAFQNNILSCSNFNSTQNTNNSVGDELVSCRAQHSCWPYQIMFLNTGSPYTYLSLPGICGNGVTLFYFQPMALPFYCARSVERTVLKRRSRTGGKEMS